MALASQLTSVEIVAANDSALERVEFKFVHGYDVLLDEKSGEKGDWINTPTAEIPAHIGLHMVAVFARLKEAKAD